MRQADINQVSKHFFQSKKEVKKKLQKLQKCCKKCAILNLEDHNTNSTEKMIKCHRRSEIHAGL